MRYLTDSDQQALRLAGELQAAVQQWLQGRGVTNSCMISPYVDQTGQPAVLIQMNAHLASAMIASFNEQQIRPAEPWPAEPWPADAGSQQFRP